MEKLKICLKLSSRLLLIIFLYPYLTCNIMMDENNPTWMAIAGTMSLTPMLIARCFICDKDLLYIIWYAWTAILCLYGYIADEILKKIERKIDVFI